MVYVPLDFQSFLRILSDALYESFPFALGVGIVCASSMHIITAFTSPFRSIGFRRTRGLLLYIQRCFFVFMFSMVAFMAFFVFMSNNPGPVFRSIRIDDKLETARTSVHETSNGRYIVVTRDPEVFYSDENVMEPDDIQKKNENQRKSNFPLFASSLRLKFEDLNGETVDTLSPIYVSPEGDKAQFLIEHTRLFDRYNRSATAYLEDFETVDSNGTHPCLDTDLTVAFPGLDVLEFMEWIRPLVLNYIKASVLWTTVLIVFGVLFVLRTSPYAVTERERKFFADGSAKLMMLGISLSNFVLLAIPLGGLCEFLPLF